MLLHSQNSVALLLLQEQRTLLVLLISEQTNEYHCNLQTIKVSFSSEMGASHLKYNRLCKLRDLLTSTKLAAAGSVDETITIYSTNSKTQIRRTLNAHSGHKN